MLKRDAPRPFVRYPEDVANYVELGNGSYGQVNSTNVWQRASKSTDGRESLLNTVYDFAGGWSPSATSLLSWWVSGGRPLGDPRDADLSKSVGSALGINSTLRNDDLDLKELYWAQLAGERLRWSVGLIDSSWRYDVNDTANSDRERYLSPALGNSAAIPFPDRSLAADFLWSAGPGLELHVGLYQTSCTEESRSCIDDLKSDQWFTPAELTLKRSSERWGSGTYRLLGYWSRAGTREGSGLSLNLEQEMGAFTPFLRLSVASGDVADFDRFASAGITFAAPLARAHDAIGVAFAAGRPTDRNKRTEWLFETYWRFQLNPFVSLSPHAQLVIDPADNPDADQVLVAGLRLQIDL